MVLRNYRHVNGNKERSTAAPHKSPAIDAGKPPFLDAAVEPELHAVAAADFRFGAFCRLSSDAEPRPRSARSGLHIVRLVCIAGAAVVRAPSITGAR